MSIPFIMTVMPLAVLSRSLLEVSYDSLHSSSVQADILQAVIGQGILAIKSLPPSFTEAQSILAEALPLCSGGREDVMGDGTIRTTLAQVSADESPAFLRNRACPVSTVQARRDVHTTLDHVGQRVAGAMDRGLHIEHPVGEADTVKKLIELGRSSHLDHYHIYRRSQKDVAETSVVTGISWRTGKAWRWNSYLKAHPDCGSYRGSGSYLQLPGFSGTRHSLHCRNPSQNFPKSYRDGSDTVFCTQLNHTAPLHVDQGLFLLLVLPPGDSSFHFIDLETDEEVPLHIPAHGGVRIVVFFGNTLAKFTGTTPRVRPLPHSVKMTHGPATRVVIGRMFLLPPDAVSNSLSPSMTYSQWNKEVVTPRSTDTEEVVEAKRRLVTACGDGEIYCWMQCMAAECSAGLRPVCFDPSSDHSCDPSVMDRQCRVECQAQQAPTPTVNPSAFCSGSTAMFMTGFTWSGDARKPCVILLIPSWVLDTPGKFAAGCIASVVLGILIEGLLAARRRFLSYIRRSLLRGLVGALGFGLSVAVAYLAMLIIMTYSCELFICVCIGLVIGHFAFGNVRQSVGESADPCCGDTTVTRPTECPNACHKVIDEGTDSSRDIPVTSGERV